MPHEQSTRLQHVRTLTRRGDAYSKSGLLAGREPRGCAAAAVTQTCERRSFSVRRKERGSGHRRNSRAGRAGGLRVSSHCIDVVQVHTTTDEAAWGAAAGTSLSGTTNGRNAACDGSWRAAVAPTDAVRAPGKPLQSPFVRRHHATRRRTTTWSRHHMHKATHIAWDQGATVARTPACAAGATAAARVFGGSDGASDFGVSSRAESNETTVY